LFEGGNKGDIVEGVLKLEGRGALGILGIGLLLTGLIELTEAYAKGSKVAYPGLKF
jgi:hypothetical protein